MSDKKNKDNRKEDTKSKKNMKKTQEMPVSTVALRAKRN